MKNSGTWNEPLVCCTFFRRDVEEILCLDVTMQDEIVWKFDPSGCYTVRSAYKRCMEGVGSLSHLKVLGQWDLLWPLLFPKGEHVSLAYSSQLSSYQMVLE